MKLENNNEIINYLNENRQNWKFFSSKTVTAIKDGAFRLARGRNKANATRRIRDDEHELIAESLNRYSGDAKKEIKTKNEQTNEKLKVVYYRTFNEGTNNHPDLFRKVQVSTITGATDWNILCYGARVDWEDVIGYTL